MDGSFLCYRRKVKSCFKSGSFFELPSPAQRAARTEYPTRTVTIRLLTCKTPGSGYELTIELVLNRCWPVDVYARFSTVAGFSRRSNHFDY
jgi:hypothetical protein